MKFEAELEVITKFVCATLDASIMLVLAIRPNPYQTLISHMKLVNCYWLTNTTLSPHYTLQCHTTHFPSNFYQYLLSITDRPRIPLWTIYIYIYQRISSRIDRINISNLSNYCEMDLNVWINLRYIFTIYCLTKRKIKIMGSNSTNICICSKICGFVLLRTKNVGVKLLSDGTWIYSLVQNSYIGNGGNENKNRSMEGVKVEIDEWKIEISLMWVCPKFHLLNHYNPH